MAHSGTTPGTAQPAAPSLLGPGSSSLFFWAGPARRSANRLHYRQFCLNNQTFNIGDCVYLFPEDETHPHYLGRILDAFVDEPSAGSEPPAHSIEIKWYERRTKLEQMTKGLEESEKEVFELEDTDINPIGCISGKCCIIRSPSYLEAKKAMQASESDWYFCRGFFLQTSNSFKPYSEAELAAQEAQPSGRTDPLQVTSLQLPAAASGLADHTQGVPSGHGLVPLNLPSSAPAAPDAAAGRIPHLAPHQQQQLLHQYPAAGHHPYQQQHPMLQQQQHHHQHHPSHHHSEGEDPSHSAEEEEERPAAGGRSTSGRAPRSEARPAAKPPPPKRKATGQVCLECGATSTPQWREGPAGPKTLCNACGVRHVRSQQRAANSSGRGTAPRGGRSSGGGSGRRRAEKAS